MLDVDSIGTGLAILGTAEVSKDAVQRLLAPTADYIGLGILQGTKATVNTVRVLASAVRKLGPGLDEPGGVSPRIMRSILDQAPFCDDELTAEYLGGILACSYNSIDRDDRGVALLSTINRLSTYAIRTHYVCYREYCRLLSGRLTFEKVFPQEDLPNLRVAEDTRMLAAMTAYSSAMCLEPDEDYYQIYRHSRRSLGREDLLGFGPQGDKEVLSVSLSRAHAENTYRIHEDGFIYDSTSAGDELFLWGLGLRGLGDSVDFLLVDGRLGQEAFVAGIPEVEGFVPVIDQTI